MNLSITPVNLKNNNQTQNFNGLKAKVFRHPEDGKDVLNTLRKRDETVDVFLAKVEEFAKQIGVNTDKMDEQGYFVEFVPKFAFSSKMSAHLKNKDQNLNHLPVTAHIRRGHETPQAESFAHMLKGVNLDIQG